MWSSIRASIVVSNFCKKIFFLSHVHTMLQFIFHQSVQYWKHYGAYLQIKYNSMTLQLVCILTVVEDLANSHIHMWFLWNIIPDQLQCIQKSNNIDANRFEYIMTGDWWMSGYKLKSKEQSNHAASSWIKYSLRRNKQDIRVRHAHRRCSSYFFYCLLLASNRTRHYSSRTVLHVGGLLVQKSISHCGCL